MPARAHLPSKLTAVGGGLVLAGVLASTAARGQDAVRNQGFIPYNDPPILYSTTEAHDPVADLQGRLDRGETRLLREDGPRGYLRSILAALDVPVSSQTLVFSKTSFQFRKISPATPRALYFNDDVYVGWVHGGKTEIIAFDPMQGAIFYVLDDKTDPERPTFERAELDCTQCHLTGATRGVPGVFLRSVHAKPTGTLAPRADTFVTGHESPLHERFGGWYVTGTHGTTTHMGNAVVRDPDGASVLDREAGANVVDLSTRLDTSPYLSPHSDIVAHLVQAHQTQMHNLITKTNFETRLALHAEAGGTAAEGSARQRYEAVAEKLLRYLLFVDEAPLGGPVTGTSGFAEAFAKRGPRDRKGRSLRDFDLNVRLFRYPCSYLIDSAAFDALPDPARAYLYRRLLEVLSGRDQSPAFARLGADDRTAIFEILLATKRGLPREWQTYARELRKQARTRTTGSPAVQTVE